MNYDKYGKLINEVQCKNCNKTFRFGGTIYEGNYIGSVEAYICNSCMPTRNSKLLYLSPSMQDHLESLQNKIKQD